MKISRALHTAVLLFSASAASALAQNVVRDPGFEEGLNGWNQPYIPADSKNRGCTATVVAENPYAGRYCLRMESEDEGRVSISPKGMPLAVVPGQRYKLSLRVRAGELFVPEKGQPGFLVRIELTERKKTSSIISVDWKGQMKVLAPASPVVGFSAEPIPRQWTHVETTFAIPENIDEMRLGIFLWRATGQLFVDDVVLERIPTR